MSTLSARLTRRSSAEVTVECRQYGATVAERTTSCPACGAYEFARYELSS